MFHIVDDEKIIRDVLVGIIKSFEVEAVAFASASEYLKHMNEDNYQSPTAIFSDVRMPEINGYDFMYQVRQINPTQKFVIISGNPDIEHNYKNLACMYLCKPFIPDSLKKIVSILIQCDKRCVLDNIENRLSDDRDMFKLKEWKCPNG